MSFDAVGEGLSSRKRTGGEVAFVTLEETRPVTKHAINMIVTNLPASAEEVRSILLKYDDKGEEMLANRLEYLNKHNYSGDYSTLNILVHPAVQQLPKFCVSGQYTQLRIVRTADPKDTGPLHIAGSSLYSGVRLDEWRQLEDNTLLIGHGSGIVIGEADKKEAAASRAAPAVANDKRYSDCACGNGRDNRGNKDDTDELEDELEDDDALDKDRLEDEDELEDQNEKDERKVHKAVQTIAKHKRPWWRFRMTFAVGFH